VQRRQKVARKRLAEIYRQEIDNDQQKAAAFARTTVFNELELLPETRFACQTGRGERFKSYSQIGANSYEGCAAACNADAECKAFDYVVGKTRLRELFIKGNPRLAKSDLGYACRLYKANKPRLGDAGSVDSRRYCEKAERVPATRTKPRMKRRKAKRRVQWGKYSCQSGKGELHKSYRQSPSSSLESCAALCSADEECKAIDFPLAKSSDAELIKQNPLLAKSDEGYTCRLYKANEPRLGIAGWSRNHKYCEKKW